MITAERKVIAAIIAGLAVSAVSYADMMPVAGFDAGYRQSPRACVPTEQHSANFSSPFGVYAVADLDLPAVGCLPTANKGFEQDSEIRPVQILSDEQNSFSLCLYALLTLGLCKSAPFVKKLHFGSVPQWYHDGGPSQIGHSFAISPDCLCDAPALCFVQPDCTRQDPLPQYYMGIVTSLLRKSLFTPNVLDPRGPPLRSC